MDRTQKKKEVTRVTNCYNCEVMFLNEQ